jgi:hypothetical protein
MGEYIQVNTNINIITVKSHYINITCIILYINITVKLFITHYLVIMNSFIRVICVLHLFTVYFRILYLLV